MSSVLDAPPVKAGAASYVALLGTIAAHGALGLLATLAGARVVAEARNLLPISEMVEVEMPEPPPAPRAEPAPAEPTPTRVKVAQPTPEPPPPPAAAQAGEVLDAKSDVVDFGDTMVVGSGSAYAGGTTDSQGTSTTAVRDVAARGDAPPAPKPAPAVVANLSRPPQLAGGMRWDCPFPIEADDAGLDHAVVTLRIDVAADGAVRKVTVVSDPGSGFGREARRCAGSKRWVPGLDRAGAASVASATVNVRFDR